jgi:hypothetical protein
MSTLSIPNRRAIVAAVPIILVNGVAFSGQFAYIRDHINWILPGQIAFALALESVAVYLAYMAHEALKAEDSAYGLRLASYGFGFIIGILNYSHYAANGRPTFEAVATGLMSVASPWLWGIYSRRNSRDVLKEKGLIEPKAVKLGIMRWALWRKESFQVFKRAIWTGENRPDIAITEWEREQTEKANAEPVTPDVPESNTPENAENKSEAVRIALRELGMDAKAPDVVSWLAEFEWSVSPEFVRVIKSKMNRAARIPVQPLKALPGGLGSREPNRL